MWEKTVEMITFLIVYKFHSSPVINNMKYMSDGAPCLSDIQLKIIETHTCKLTDFAILNIVPVKTELLK